MPHPRAQILRDRVQQCYRTEGVNHYQNCREVRASRLRRIVAARARRAA
jgi:hypothetical protein